tara:strand:- start:46 stop:489 length:444 start_codon:yes stop_codon:yes gene_type:complete
MPHNTPSTLLKQFKEIIAPLFEQNGSINSIHLAQKEKLEYFMALLLNRAIATSSNPNDQSFGADYIVVSKLVVENNAQLHYWGKIYWLSAPKTHRCHRGFQDPFYCLISFKNESVEISNGTFGDYSFSDLDSDLWMENNIDWMYDFT